MKRLPFAFPALVALLAATSLTPASANPIIRVPGAMYLSDFGQKPLRLKVLQPNTPCFFDVEQTRWVGNLRFPQTVQVEALTDSLARIRGNAQQGGVAGWVPTSALEPLPDGLLTALQKATERREIVEGLIAQREVAIGMTPEEVQRSLGRPQKKTQRANASGSTQIWEYVRFELVPQTTYTPGFNQTIVTIPGTNKKYPEQTTIVSGGTGFNANTIYIKVPVGTLTVSFKDGVVEALDQTEGSLAAAAGQVSVVVPPINVYW